MGLRQGFRERITPARAGNSATFDITCQREWDHPRACGEQAYVTIDIYIQGGSPPRVRGTAASGGYPP